MATFNFALCNEVLRPMSFEAQCQCAASLGYVGLEVAPFTLHDSPQNISLKQARIWGQMAIDHGVPVTGLHWLLVAPDGLSITDPHPQVSKRTRELVQHLCDVCAEMGGRYLVHGSPQQRQPVHPQSKGQAWDACCEFFAVAGQWAHARGLTYCIEPLSADQTSIINTLAEAVQMIEEIGQPGLQTMLDTSSAGLTERQSIVDLIELHLPTGHLAHVQLNDPNRRAPGQGDMDFGPILQALHRHRYQGPLAIEPFEYSPDGPACAAFAIDHLEGLAQKI
jgi:D-psicose/D-tagatose/L-ribulose 3-epimerase